MHTYTYIYIQIYIHAYIYIYIYHHQHYIQPLLVHCRTQAFPHILHLSLSDFSELQLGPANALISSLHLTLSALTSPTIPGLPLCYSRGPSVVTSSHDMPCPCPLLALNCH